jgi:hypothetical protein
MRPRFPDYAWATFALLFGGLSAVGLVFRIIDVANGDVDFAVGLLSLVVGPVAAFWIMAGAWRRTIWGTHPRDAA